MEKSTKVEVGVDHIKNAMNTVEQIRTGSFEIFYLTSCYQWDNLHRIFLACPFWSTLFSNKCSAQPQNDFLSP